MKFFPIIVGNLMRRKQRTFFTAFSVMIAFLLFCILSATNRTFIGDEDLLAKDRLYSVNGSSWTEPLPLSYYNELMGFDGVVAVSHKTFFDGFFGERQTSIDAEAIDGEKFLYIHQEYSISDGQRIGWLNNRIGAIIGSDLAQQYGWKVGRRFQLQSAIWPGVWDFVVEGIYVDMTENSTSESMFFHYDYLNESRLFQKDTVGFYQLKVESADQADDIAKKIDVFFANSYAPTRTASELSFIKDVLAQFANVKLIAVTVASIVFITLLLSVASTMGLAIRERRNELAVMRVFGFSRATLLLLIICESILLTSIGASLGIGFSLPIVDLIGSGRTRGLALQFGDAVVGGVLALIFGGIAGVIPGIGAIRRSPISSLRRG